MPKEGKSFYKGKGSGKQGGKRKSKKAKVGSKTISR